MACPTMNFNGITREVYDCLVKQAETMGFPAPQSPSGRVAYHNVEADYRCDDAEGTLEITITRGPDWLDCSLVESRVRQAMRSCGAA